MPRTLAEPCSRATPRWRRGWGKCAIGLTCLLSGCATTSSTDPFGGTIEQGGSPSVAGQASSGSGANNASGAVGIGGAVGTSGSASTGGATSAGTGNAGTSNAGGAIAMGSGGAPHTGSAGSTQTGSGGQCNGAGPNGESFFDSFEDGEYLHCPEWIAADSTLNPMWSVKDDGGAKVLAQSAAISSWAIAVSGNYMITDQTVQAKVKFTSDPGYIGVFARFHDVSNYYFLYLDGSNLVLRGRVNNSQLTSIKAKTPTVKNTWYTLKLSVVGSTLTGYLDGMKLVTTTDSSVKSGGVAVGTGNSATGEFDDVTVTVP